MISITRQLAFDAGHRIPNHPAGCANIHGHRYVLEISLRGDLQTQLDPAEEGMLLDFGHIKTLAQKHLIDRWDHAFFVYRRDHWVMDFLQQKPDHKTVILETVPTVENLARLAYETLEKVLHAQYADRLRLEKIRLYETPNCWADFCV